MNLIKNIGLNFLVIVLLSCSDNTTIQNNDLSFISIDTVYSFTPGESQNAGQDSLYYPKNIFGKPVSNSNINVPANSPEYILSLGLGGEIIIGFKNYKIINGNGADFIIFENVFVNPVNGKYFIEPAEVSVSNDGIHYIHFAFDSLTFLGCAGITPTLWNNKHLENIGGDRFDLSSVGLDFITHIKIRDISRLILENPLHPNYDSIISGFDLDAVIGINFERKK